MAVDHAVQQASNNNRPKVRNTLLEVEVDGSVVRHGTRTGSHWLSCAACTGGLGLSALSICSSQCFYTGQRVVLIWGAGWRPHWSTRTRAWLDSQHDWLTTERLPAYAPS
jgi:hypothetical protein